MMVVFDESSAHARWLADLIEHERDRILEDYRLELGSLDSLLARDPAALDQATAIAGPILEDVCAGLRDGVEKLDDGYRATAWETGATGAAHGMHPDELVQTASVFFAVVLSLIACRSAQRPAALGLLTQAAMVLERGIALHMRAATTAYTSFLINEMREAQAAERRRIARDLHDRIGHGISVAHRQLELFAHYQHSDTVKAAAKAAAAQRATQECMQDLRAVTAGLYSHEALGSLDTALLNYLETATDEGLQSRVRVDGDEVWAPPHVRDEAFLVLREAAHNALRHGAPSTLVINVDIAPRQLRAFVEDDGRGFDPDTPDLRGMGVRSMRERIRLLGGTLAVRSRPGHGTRVHFTIPLGGGTDDDQA
jgi:signal transduction histidine kinase